MPYCAKCGVENPAAARFCDQCGAALVPVPAPAPVSYTPQLTVPRPVAAQPVAPPPRPAPSVAPLAAGPIVCAQCGASAIPGEAFCDNCGAPLSAPAPAGVTQPNPVYNSGLAPQPSFPTPQSSIPVPQPVYSPPSPPVAIPAARLSLAPARLVLENGVTLALPNSTQAVVGRADQVSNFTPDIDLGPYGALDHGVGRRHARLFIQQGQIMVEDLNSTNGSSLEGISLKPNQPQPVVDNAQLLFGSLRMRFVP